jgi:light-regulated signal transduction histidine kinase (bacteriophytochrome)
VERETMDEIKDDRDEEIRMLRAACAELEEQVKLLVKTELKLRRTQAELMDSQKKIEVSNRTLEKKVRERTQELERRNAELADFASIVSHDLKEPLRKISVFGDRLRDVFRPALDERGLDFIERIRSSAERMSNLINDLLSYTRVTAGAETHGLVDLSRIMGEVTADLEIRIEKSAGIVTASGLPFLEADPVQMRQLFQNFISNALKFHAPDRPPVIRVTGRTVTGAGACEIVFEDNGIGIEPRYFDKIFGVFQRLHSRDDYEGSGIGLAICKKIVEHHTGSIRLESTPGKGTMFIIRLPLKQKPPA